MNKITVLPTTVNTTEKQKSLNDDKQFNRKKYFNKYGTKNRKEKDSVSDTDELCFQDKMKIKNNVINEKIKCVINEVNYNDETVELEVSPKCVEKISKILTLDASLKLDSLSEYEKFLRDQGISPHEDNIELKILDKEIKMSVSEIEDGIRLNYNCEDKSDNIDKNNQSPFVSDQKN